MKEVEVTVAPFIENNKGEILLVHSEKWNNTWFLPGGHIESGDTIIDTALREAKEETNLDLNPIFILGFKEFINSKYFFRPAHFICFVVYCKVKGLLEIKLNHEADDYRWIKPEQALEEDLSPDLKEIVRDFIKYKNET